VYLANSDDEVRAAAAELLPDSELAERDLVLALIAARGDIGAHRLLVSELISSDPTAACDLVAEAPTWLEPDTAKRLVALARDVGESGREALEESGRQGERLAWRLRARSGRLDLSQTVDLLSDDSAEVRRHALEALIDADVAIPPSMIATTLEGERGAFRLDSEDRSELALRGLQLHSVDELMAYVSWLDSTTGLALWAAARRDDGAAAIARARCKASDGLPATVTTPGRSAWRYWRWLPRMRASSQPAASMRLIASRTLTGTRSTLRPESSKTSSSGPSAASPATILLTTSAGGAA